MSTHITSVRSENFNYVTDPNWGELCSVRSSNLSYDYSRMVTLRSSSSPTYAGLYASEGIQAHLYSRSHNVTIAACDSYITPTSKVSRTPQLPLSPFTSD